MANPNDQDFLRVVITRINDWAMTGNFLPFLDLFHRQGRIKVISPYREGRFDTREELEAFCRENRPGLTMSYTHEAEMPIGAFASFRWKNQTEDMDAGNLITDMLDGKILQLNWEFMPVTRHPMAIAQGGTVAPAAPKALAPAASPFKPMSQAPAAMTAAAQPAPVRPAPAAPASPAAAVRATPAAPTAPAPAAPATPAQAAPAPAQPASSPSKPVFL